jgi:hypothetical protein
LTIDVLHNELKWLGKMGICNVDRIQVTGMLRCCEVCGINIILPTIKGIEVALL